MSKPKKYEWQEPVVKKVKLMEPARARMIGGKSNPGLMRPVEILKGTPLAELVRRNSVRGVVSRNSPCPCGKFSLRGKVRFKNCCGRKK